MPAELSIPPQSASKDARPHPHPAPVPNSGAPGRGVPKPAGRSQESRIRKVQDLIGRVEALPDPDTRALVEELLRSVMELHGAGLRQMLEIVRHAGPPGAAAYAAPPLVCLGAAASL